MPNLVSGQQIDLNLKNFGCPAITLSDENKVMVNEAQCTGCDVCVNICPSDAIKPKD